MAKNQPGKPPKKETLNLRPIPKHKTWLMISIGLFSAWVVFLIVMACLTA